MKKKQFPALAGAAAVLLLLGNGAALAATSPDGVWRDVSEATVQASGTGQRLVVPQAYRTVALAPAALAAILDRAPDEVPGGLPRSEAVLSLPIPSGGFGRFRIEKSPVLEPDLAAKFPEIRTYRGQGVDDPYATVRLDRTPAGFHAQVLSAASGAIYVDPYRRGDTTNHVVYFRKDFARPSGKLFRCSVTGNEVPPTGARPAALGLAPLDSTGPTLLTYRIAIAATGEYTAFHGGTVANALAAIATTLNRVDGVYEREVAIRMVLVGNENLVVYTNAATDPYTNDDPGALLGENQTNLDAVIGSASYDIGHVFSTGGGGLAGLGVVCLAGYKAQGETGSSAPVGDPFDIDYVAHEIGHQWGANHTFNGTTGACSGNRAASAAYEPGSGSTIMAYAGICGAEDLQSNSDAIFHGRSFDEIVAYSRTGSGNACGTPTSTGNGAPTVNAGASHTVPKGTPFTLTGSATDPDGDALTYLWEEYDLGTAAPPNTDNGNRPIFRDFTPTTSPARTLPRLADVLSGTPTFGESLPTTSRTMTFRLTARDNRAGGGGVSSSTTTVAVSSAAGPFAVTAPSTAVSWNSGSTQTITWDVLGTNAAPVSCTNVDILLSTDGGNTFPTTVVAATPNDGTESVTVPSVATTSQARVKVACTGNIFFAVSRPDFTINATPVELLQMQIE